MTKTLNLDTAAKERSTEIEIDGNKYNLILTTKATKEIGIRYGGLEKLGDKLMNSKAFEESLDEVIWLVTLLANQSILIHNIRNKDEKMNLLEEAEVELLTTPYELAGFKDAIIECMTKGAKRNVESEPGKNARVG